MQNSRFRSAKSKLPFSIEIIFTKLRLLLASLLEFLKDSSFVSFTKKLALRHFDTQSARGKQIVIRNKSWGVEATRMRAGCTPFPLSVADLALLLRFVFNNVGNAFYQSFEWHTALFAHHLHIGARHNELAQRRLEHTEG